MCHTVRRGCTLPHLEREVQSRCVHLGNCRLLRPCTQTKQPSSPHTGTSHRARDTTQDNPASAVFDQQYRNAHSKALAMAPGQKAYPRGTVKKIIKAHSNCNLSKNVDVMVSTVLTRLERAADLPPDLSRLCAIHADVSHQCNRPRNLRCLPCHRLVKEAAIESKKSGERGITARSVKKVTSVCPRNAGFSSYGCSKTDNVSYRTL